MVCGWACFPVLLGAAWCQVTGVLGCSVYSETRAPGFFGGFPTEGVYVIRRTKTLPVVRVVASPRVVRSFDAHVGHRLSLTGGGGGKGRNVSPSIGKMPTVR